MWPTGRRVTTDLVLAAFSLLVYQKTVCGGSWPSGIALVCTGPCQGTEPLNTGAPSRQVPCRADSPGFWPEALGLFASHTGQKASPRRLWPVCQDAALAAGSGEPSRLSIQAR